MSIAAKSKASADASRRISVSVSRIFSASPATADWLVTISSAKDNQVILFRKYASLDLALGFAAEALPSLAANTTYVCRLDEQ